MAFASIQSFHTSNEYLKLANALVRMHFVSMHGINIWLYHDLLVYLCYHFMWVCMYVCVCACVCWSTVCCSPFHIEIDLNYKLVWPSVRFVLRSIDSNDFQMKASLSRWWTASTITTTNRYHLLIRCFELKLFREKKIKIDILMKQSQNARKSAYTVEMLYNICTPCLPMCIWL